MTLWQGQNYRISIHALLAESDRDCLQNQVWKLLFLSTLSLRRATCARGIPLDPFHISIHALLAESDIAVRATKAIIRISIHALLAESDLCKLPSGNMAR